MPELMLVEDEAIISMQLQKRLTSLGYSVVGCAANGDESIEMAERLRPDLILMDIVMPGKLDGIDAARVIRKTTGIPVIFVTAWSDDEFVIRAKETRPYGYILKPYNEREIKAMIEVALHRRHAEMVDSERAEWARLMLNSLDAGVVSLREDGTIFHCNTAIERIFGFTCGELDGELFYDLLTPSIRDEVAGILESIDFTHDYPTPLPVKTSGAVGRNRDGDTLFLEISYFPLMFGGRGLVTLLVNQFDTDEVWGSGESDETDRLILPICSNCKKIRDRHHQWMDIDEYFRIRTGIRFTHSICPDCINELYPDLFNDLPDEE